MDPKTGRTMIGIAGLTLLVGFFLPWIDVGGGGLHMTASGWYVVKNSTFGSMQMMMIGVPVAGIVMMLGALASLKAARLASLLSGLALGGYTAWKIVSTFFAVTGWGLWLVIAAGCFALVAPLMIARERR